MALTDQDVLAALKKIPYPGFTRDIVSAGAIRNAMRLFKDDFLVLNGRGGGKGPVQLISFYRK